MSPPISKEAPSVVSTPSTARGQEAGAFRFLKIFCFSPLFSGLVQTLAPHILNLSHSVPVAFAHVTSMLPLPLGVKFGLPVNYTHCIAHEKVRLL